MEIKPQNRTVLVKKHPKKTTESGIVLNDVGPLVQATVIDSSHPDIFKDDEVMVYSTVGREFPNGLTLVNGDSDILCQML